MKFKFVYIDKIKSEKSIQAQRGIDVHQFCNEFYDHLTFVENSFILDPNFKESYLNKCVPEAIEYIDNFINFEQSYWEICKNLMPKNPKKLFMPLLREAKFFTETLEQVTILDRLDLRVDDNYTLVEIKTEKYRPVAWKATEFRREMMFEKLTAEASPEFQKQFPNSIIDFVIYFPRSNDIFCGNFDWRTEKALAKALEKMRQDIKDENYPCNVAYACRFCNYNLKCSMEMSKRKS